MSIGKVENELVKGKEEMDARPLKLGQREVTSPIYRTRSYKVWLMHDPQTSRDVTFYERIQRKLLLMY
jgi:hypothetical protein